MEELEKNKKNVEHICEKVMGSSFSFLVFHFVSHLNIQLNMMWLAIILV